MDPIKAYLRSENLSKDRQAADKIKKRSFMFYLGNDRLCKTSFLMPLLLCLKEEEVEYVLRELHEGICGSQPVGSSLNLKALRNDCFLPTMKADTLDLLKRCDKCRGTLMFQESRWLNRHPWL